VPPINKSLFKKSVINRGNKLYNRLPLAIKESGFKDFKYKLKSFLLAHPFYTLNSFLQVILKQ
jgi:hypothetical protein